MKKFIARFRASHEDFKHEQYSCITWQQDGDEPDTNTLIGLVRQNTACHFFNMFTDENVDPDLITVQIEKIERM